MRLQGVLNVLNKKQLFALNENIGKYSHKFMHLLWQYKSEMFLSAHAFKKKNAFFVKKSPI
jgi:hypothetical protein